MPSVNLIPLELLQERIRSRRIRMWVAFGAMVWGLAFIPMVRELYAQYCLSEERAAVARVSEALHEAFTQRARSTRRLRMLKEEIERAEKLRYKRSWTGMFATLSETIPREVWLMSIATDPPRPKSTPGVLTPIMGSDAVGVASSARPSRLVGREGPRRLVLRCFALGLEDAYVFVRGLSSLSVFKYASITSFEKDSVEKEPVTRFTLECEW